MKGVVEVYRGEEKILEEPNMLMDNMSKQIAFWMSLPRGFGEIPSASAIYDTSNYTVRAASLGKDAAGYSHHAHRTDISEVIPTDNTIRVYSFEGSSTSAYRTEEFASYVEDEVTRTIDGNPVTFSSRKTRHAVLPEFSHPKMQRLEEKSTKVPGVVADEADFGHNLNYIFAAEALGCYAPSGQTTFEILSALPYSPTNVAKTRTITNDDGFNSLDGQAAKAIDYFGHIRMTVNNKEDGLAAEDAGNFYKGLLLSYDNNTWIPALGKFSVKHVIGLKPADTLCLNFFGGVYTIGLWGYDVEGMIKKGKYPPYTNYPLNVLADRAEYKLFARITFTRDILEYDNIDIVNDRKITWRFNFP